MNVAYSTLLRASNVTVSAGGSRSLFQGLSLSMGAEKVALIGRNGVGKSTLLEVLAGHTPPEHGQLTQSGSSWLVRQRTTSEQIHGFLERWAKEEDLYLVNLEGEAMGLAPYHHLVAADGWSCGQQQKVALLDAKLRRPDLLLLDEPTEALDAAGRAWLFQLLDEWEGGLMVVSHDTECLRRFEHFMVVSEAGGRYVEGHLDDVLNECQLWNEKQEKRYLQSLQTLEEREWHNARVCRRRARKKNLGRIHETGRSPSRSWLNSKRSYAQESQGRAAKVRKHRQIQVREWAKATRRAMDVQLTLELEVPTLAPPSQAPIVSLHDVSCSAGERVLFEGLSLDVRRERLAIVGPNGSGKTTLLRMMSGEYEPQSGCIQVQHAKVGWIAQRAANWMLDDSLSTWLMWRHGLSLEDVAALLVSHKFPLSLAQRPMRTLSPGERLRAALLCLYQQAPEVECLLLDEPTGSLDFSGADGLLEQLALWPGGLVIATHDLSFLEDIGIQQTLTLG
ncbi:MAG: ABC-F family ATP-binding cassette domain-containing protein [Deltaproteobacteria bacterium]|nr:MAG: ABC-F family ATP-binding cassette domain-containing protein [Deltaproteobacteria bacterium]